jgi:ABC-2 type transport system ATP-binding protein
LKQLLGMQLQETQFSDKLTVEETVRLFRSFYRRPLAVEETIALVQLEQKRTARVGQLSGGQKQRLAMAVALVGNPGSSFWMSRARVWTRRRAARCGTWWTGSSPPAAPFC